ncbi:hypothetical protein BV20DRAFT_944842 [Pilatotrama ljubarskyi]|nr:hypothetical protein BV20DRAFT_944842 [Pilatotrama ljubarskyi]
MPGTLSNGDDRKVEAATGSASNSLEADIALLSSLLSQNVDESDPDVAELLRRLEAAEGIADGVESRLDGIIGHLDSLLGDLETQASPGQGESRAVMVTHVEEEVVVATSAPEKAQEGEQK